MAGLALAGALPTPAIAERAPLRIGVMLPATGVYAEIGRQVVEGFDLRLDQLGGRLGGRSVEFVRVDDQSRPDMAEGLMRRLIERDKVDLVIGSVHSGVSIVMADIARRTSTLMIVPVAGANEITDSLCAPNIWRTSFSNWQVCRPMGAVVARDGHHTAMTISWRYAAGQQTCDAFAQGFIASGGTVVSQLYLPFPMTDFTPLLAQIKVRKPDAVFAFFAGPPAAQFIRAYAAEGLRERIPLYGQGSLTDGIPAMPEAQGVRTTFHYAAGLNLQADRDFRAAYRARTGHEGDAYAVHGFDTATLLDIGLSTADGDVKNRAALYRAMGAAAIDSPRGRIAFSKSNHVIQNVYLREFRNGANEFLSVVDAAAKSPEDGCRAGAKRVSGAPEPMPTDSFSAAL